MVVLVALTERVVLLLVGKQGLHAGHLEIHLNSVGRASSAARLMGMTWLLFAVHGGADGGEQVGVLRRDGVLLIQLQGADKGFLQLRQEMQRAAQEGHVPADGLAAGQAADGLVDHRLENGGGQILLWWRPR